LVTLNRPEVLNAVNSQMHYELATIWPDLDRDNEVKVIVVTGAGKAFSAGGDLQMTTEMTKNVDALNKAYKEARDLVYNMINCEKPIIAAINGVAVGAGMAVALMSDITIMSEDARFNDGHIRLGVAAGDHICCILPLLISMSKTKYYVLTGDFITAKDAEKMNLVTEILPKDKVLPRALQIADVLSRGPQLAIRYTKRALNQWLRQAGITSFDLSCAVEMLTFVDKDVEEGIRALKAKEKPSFPTAQPDTFTRSKL